ncbi:efflux system DNA-binding response regulator AdeR [Acinetobacter qingfengensis]|uniref:Efflux system DNA-binding response regulator AdeR n=1 Tax=Acinetobacter qingfengensis TaxID=1262585 RepID=A0A1E7R414_9GAMM|nr:efflux system response regulator transcription factor AdeR [Acinetobacter qingfengensis]KAA8731466.1 efflux system DNA-binding response regulator AdeR [Acinetobacter qingfengensis]OEY94023.1 efflux system DNA-binding response regulator AdeR [Acinetobacter qingfengensis]
MYNTYFSLDLKNKAILVVEDDYDIGDIIEQYLKRENALVLRANNGVQALEIHATQQIDLILLDVKLPKMNGWDILNNIRQHSQTPVIMLTALDQDIDKVMALRIGADDFIVKPFNPNEMIARVQAVLRRSQIQTSSASHIHRYKNIEIHTDTHVVYIENLSQKLALNLTLTEYKILLYMLPRPYKVFTRSELMANCLQDNDALERTVDSHVSKLRKKLEDHNVFNLLINVRGVGYKLDNQI